ncbi:MAG: hypothetical protein ACI9H6_000600 [Patiriisocius sp.]|jgi:hypothetical protein
MKGCIRYYLKNMVRLNKNQLDVKQLNALFVQLSETFGKASVPDANYLLTELLGNEERIMLAKRLATVVLLLEGTSLYKTSRVLKISPATAQKIQRQINNNSFTYIVKALGKNKKDYFIILRTLDSILHLGGTLPHYNGMDRYKGL